MNNSWARLLLFWVILTLPASALASNPEKLGAEMGARITRVPELEFIRQEAAKLGVRVYLFGGTAAAYGHYVRQDLAREGGDNRYPKHLYDYDYTNIFRSTQDLDIVIDGPADKANQLEQILKQKFPHFVGDKAAQWEVRPLREARGDKEPILDNPDFQNQHTDSHSTGMVEITQTPKGESPVKDVRDWESKKPQFLTDVAESKLHYYFNPLHETTNRAKQGMNPPILSAIRYLTKAFQYGLEISGEDRAMIQKIVSEFQPASVKNDYVKKWMEKNGKKLFQHAVDIEYAWDQLESLGLRKKLAQIRGDEKTVDTLAWWMNKEPLRTKPIGQGNGKTAKELFGTNLTLAHETNSYLSYESITRAKSGELNGLISRELYNGESAAYGDGFYTRLGRSGARNTGITIRMQLNPDAREGTDFLHKRGEFVVLRNKSAVKVIAEEISLSLPTYFRMLAEGENFSHDDRALLESFRRKMGRSGMITEADKKEIFELAKKELKKPRFYAAFFREWFKADFSREYPEIFEKLAGENAHAEFIAREVLTLPHWNHRVDVLRKMVERGDMDEILLIAPLRHGQFFDHPNLLKTKAARELKRGEGITQLLETLGVEGWSNQTQIAKDILKHGSQNQRAQVAGELLKKPSWIRHADLIDIALKDPLLHPELIIHAFPSHPEIAAPYVEKILAHSAQNDAQVATELLTQPGWEDHPHLLKTINSRNNLGKLHTFVLRNPGWAKNPDLVLEVIRRSPETAQQMQRAFKGGLGSEANPWSRHPEFFRAVHEANPKITGDLLSTLTSPGWEKNPGILDFVRGNEQYETWAIDRILSDTRWIEAQPEVIEKFLREKKYVPQIIKSVFRNSDALRLHPEWADSLLKEGKYDAALAESVATEYWIRHPEAVKTMLERGKADEAVIYFILPQMQPNEAKPLIERLLEKKSNHAALARNLMAFPGNSNKRLDWLEKIVASGKADADFTSYILGNFPDRPDWAEAIIARKNPSALSSLANMVFPEKGWEKHPELFEKLLDAAAGDVHDGFLRPFENPRWAQHPDLLRRLLRDHPKPIIYRQAMDGSLRRKHWAQYPDLIETLARHLPAGLEKDFSKLLKTPNWKKHPELLKLTGGEPPTPANLKAAFAKGLRLPVPSKATSNACAAGFAQL